MIFSLHPGIFEQTFSKHVLSFQDIVNIQLSCTFFNDQLTNKVWRRHFESKFLRNYITKENKHLDCYHKELCRHLTTIQSKIYHCFDDVCKKSMFFEIPWNSHYEFLEKLIFECEFSINFYDISQFGENDLIQSQLILNFLKPALTTLLKEVNTEENKYCKQLNVKYYCDLLVTRMKEINICFSLAKYRKYTAVQEIPLEVAAYFLEKWILGKTALKLSLFESVLDEIARKAYNCKEEGLIRKISYTLFKEYQFRIVNSVNFISTSLKTKCGPSLYIGLIFCAIARRLSLSLVLAETHDTSFFVYDQNSQNSSKISVGNTDYAISSVNRLEEPDFSYYRFLLEDMVKIAYVSHPVFADAQKMFFYEFCRLLSPSSQFIHFMWFYTNVHLDVNYDVMSKELDFFTENTPTEVDSLRWRDIHFYLQTETRKNRQHSPKTREDDQDPEVKFGVGMLLHQHRWDYMCVVCGWDAKCQQTMTWKVLNRVMDLRFQDQQPFYHVIDDTGGVRYAAQESLEFLNPQVTYRPLEVDLVGRYFSSFKLFYYEPLPPLLDVYVNDYEFLQKTLAAQYNVNI